MELEGGIRERILEAAIKILHESGARRLTQPAVARAAGVRQGHLTYYFPRRSDLFAAIAARFLELVSEAFPGSEEPADPTAVIAAAARMITDAGHMRSFLSLLLEAEQDEALRAMLREHLAAVSALVARRLGRPAGDPDVDLLLSLLRGLGLQGLLQRDAVLPETEELVAGFGLGIR